MHTNWQLIDALFKNPVALKVLVWSRGQLVILHILTSSSFSLVEETHGSSGQCVSFSLIDGGSVFTAYVVLREFRLRIVEQAAGHLRWKVDYPLSQPVFGVRTSLEATTG